MGNQRQQLKESIAGELESRIDSVQALLAKLKNEQEDTETSCLESKTQIEEAANRIAKQLAQRKVTLIEEVTALSQTHINYLQASIQKTYQILGNLQSTLSNLDSFDNSQLMKLQIPEATNLDKQTLTIDTNYDCEQLLEKINHWGEVNVSKNDNNDQILESDFILADAGSILAKSSETLLPDAFTTEWQNTIEVKNWLWNGVSEDSDDFEMLTEEPEMELRMPIVSSRVRNDSIAPSEVTDDGSSIVCLSNAEDEERYIAAQDLSVWLKPRQNCTQTGVSDSAAPIAELVPALIPPQMTESSKASTVSSKSRFLDFPGLRLDPRCWLNTKEIAMNMSDKEIIPPSYAALPYPFWLSSKCK